MARFEIQFSTPMTSAKIAGVNDYVNVVSQSVSTPEKVPTQAEASPQAEPTVASTSQTIDSIRSALEKAVTESSDQHALLQSLAARYAVEVARVFLGSMDELIEQRLQQNVLHVLQHPDAIIVKLFVHPSCRESIKEWLDENGDLRIPNLGIEVMADDGLAPGDCRVDFGRSGRLASLEEQLKLVESRLRDSIRENQQGAHE